MPRAPEERYCEAIGTREAVEEEEDGDDDDGDDDEPHSHTATRASLEKMMVMMMKKNNKKNMESFPWRVVFLMPCCQLVRLCG